MQSGQFSRTALGAAGHRAAHQVLEGGRIFADPLAMPILGEDAEASSRRPGKIRSGGACGFSSRCAAASPRTAARQAIGAGVRQIVVLGAGLDTFAYRLETSEGLRVFEVDHPATQAEKRRRLATAGIALPAHLTFAPLRFRARRTRRLLRAVGFDPDQARLLPLARRRSLSDGEGDFRDARLHREAAGRRGRVRLPQSGRDDRGSGFTRVAQTPAAAGGGGGRGVPELFRNARCCTKNCGARVWRDRGPRPEQDRRAVFPERAAPGGRRGARGSRAEVKRATRGAAPPQRRPHQQINPRRPGRWSSGGPHREP